MNNVFISYAFKDEEQAKSICRYLERFGLKCWIACRDIEVGSNYMPLITTAIRNSSAFIVLISKNSMHSQQVENEVAIANSELKNGLKRFPILIDSDVDPYSLDGALCYLATAVQICDWNQQREQKQLVQRIAEELGLELDVSSGRYTQEEVFHTPVIPEPTIEIPAETKTPKLTVAPLTFDYYKKITNSQIGIGIVLAIFFLGSTLLSCASAEHLNPYIHYASLDAMYFLTRQLRYLLIGLLFFYVCWKLPLHYLQIAAPYLMALFFISTIFVENYAYWIDIGTYTFVPGNFGLWCLILLFATYTTYYKEAAYSVKPFFYILYVWATSIISVVFLYKCSNSPFMGLLPLVIAYGITFLYTNKKLFHYILAGIIVILALLVIITVLNGSAYHGFIPVQYVGVLKEKFIPSETIQSLIETTTWMSDGFSTDLFRDFGFYALSERFFAYIYSTGWISAIIVAALYGVLLFHIFRIGNICRQHDDYFSSSICFGVMLHIGFCALYNMGMNLNLLPFTGCSLPFISDWSNEFLMCEIGCVFAVTSRLKKNIQ